MAIYSATLSTTQKCTIQQSKTVLLFIDSQSEDPPNYFRKHRVHKRQVTVGGVAAAMVVLYDLETALRNTSTVIEEFQEASTVKNLNITLEDSSPDITSINETLEQLEEGSKTLNLPNFM